MQTFLKRLFAAAVALAFFGWCFAGCSFARKLQKKTETHSERVDSTAASSNRNELQKQTAVDSAGASSSTNKANETATNTAEEETTVTLYDPVSGRPTSVTHSRRKTTGTATKSSEATATTSAKVSKQTEEKRVAEASTKTSVTRKVSSKKTDKKSDVAAKASPLSWLWIAGGVFVLGSAACKFIPRLAAVTGGGPIGLFFAWLRRRKDKTAA